MMTCQVKLGQVSKVVCQGRGVQSVQHQVHRPEAAADMQLSAASAGVTVFGEVNKQTEQVRVV